MIEDSGHGSISFRTAEANSVPLPW